MVFSTFKSKVKFFMMTASASEPATESATATVSPLQLACHADPYPTYAEYRNAGGLHYDQSLKLWIVSSASVVAEILESVKCAVRPAHEPVPAYLTGTSAGEIFGYLIRMNEGEAHHAKPKAAIQSALRGLDFSRVESQVRHRAQQLLESYRQLTQNDLANSSQNTRCWITRCMFALPVSVMAEILGFPEAEIAQVANLMTQFIACLSPLSSPEQLKAAQLAAENLSLRLNQLVQNSSCDAGSFISLYRAQAIEHGWQNTQSMQANLVGLLSQTYEATAGLIGNGLIAFWQEPKFIAQVMTDTASFKEFVKEVARHDSPVQNTRRFVHQDCTIAGQTLLQGDAILLLLASANRDPEANPTPDQRLLERASRQTFSFSRARHGCPGENLAYTISTIALEFLISQGVHKSSLWPQIEWTYQASLNGRIPLFTKFSALPT